MDRSPAKAAVWSPGRPHARGDGPSTVRIPTLTNPQAPRTWGWTINTRSLTRIETAGPTHVGMDHQHTQPHPNRNRRPHARGDGPGHPAGAASGLSQAPRTWGWTAPRRTTPRHAKAGPTHVGMDRNRVYAPTGAQGRPHARGDGPF